MDIEFVRTGERRYAVRAHRPGIPMVQMNPAPGYDPYLPHDIIHFVVEDELGLASGIFGQLASGGDAGSFYLGPSTMSSREQARARRKGKKRGARLVRDGRDQLETTERMANICRYEWLARSSKQEDRQEAQEIAGYASRDRENCSESELELLSTERIERICGRFDEVSRAWSQLAVGDSITLGWRVRA
ncbi:MAG: hypothetical protein R3E97_19965 [Candidatus Eisenbacteria bacterium]